MSHLDDLADQIEYPDGSDLCPRCYGDGILEVVGAIGEPITVTCPKCGGDG